VKFHIENIFVVSLIFTKQTITKFTNNELMQKNLHIGKRHLYNFIIDCLCIIIESVMY